MSVLNRSKLYRLRALNKHVKAKGERLRLDLEAHTTDCEEDVGVDSKAKRARLDLEASTTECEGHVGVEPAAVFGWPAGISLYEKYGDGNCGVYGVEQWFSDPHHARRRTSSGRAFYLKDHAADHAEMMLYREKMVNGFRNLSGEQREIILGAMSEELGSEELGAEATAELLEAHFAKDGAYVSIPGFHCLGRDLGLSVVTKHQSTGSGRSSLSAVSRKTGSCHPSRLS